MYNNLHYGRTSGTEPKVCGLEHLHVVYTNIFLRLKYIWKGVAETLERLKPFFPVFMLNWRILG